MSRELGIVVALPRQRATVHYVDCPWYRRAIHTHLPLPRRTKIRLCQWCRPSEEAVRGSCPEVSWYPWSPIPEEHFEVVPMDLDRAEKVAARRSLGYGKKLPYREGWS